MSPLIHLKAAEQSAAGHHLNRWLVSKDLRRTGVGKRLTPGFYLFSGIGLNVALILTETQQAVISSLQNLSDPFSYYPVGSLLSVLHTALRNEDFTSELQLQAEGRLN